MFTANTGGYVGKCFAVVTDQEHHNGRRWILKYGPDVDLDDVISLLKVKALHKDNISVNVERQLKCTGQRGLVLSFQNDESRLALEREIEDLALSPTADDGSITLVRFDDDDDDANDGTHDHVGSFHRMLEPQQGVNDLEGEGNCDYKQVCMSILDAGPPPVLTSVDVDWIKSEIRNDITTDSGSNFDGSLADNAGALLRLVFHDAASFDKNDASSLSGLNGCVNKNNAGNGGLEVAQAYLASLKDSLAGRSIDIVSLA
jgi:hypothetical protein